MNKTYSVFDTALYYLSFKDRTAYEISKKLQERDYDEVEINEALNKLIEYGYINDQRYANAYYITQSRRKGRKLILSELSKKGIDRNTLDNTECNIDLREEEVIEEIFYKRYSELDLSDDKIYRKVCSYFLRRGFLYEDISKIIAKYRKKE